ncbi:hypothetical protein M959_06590, partial [Chaetura pelagica]
CCPFPAPLPTPSPTSHSRPRFPEAAARAMGTLYSPYGASILALSWVLTLTMSRRLLLWGLGGVRTRGSGGVKK